MTQKNKCYDAEAEAKIQSLADVPKAVRAAAEYAGITDASETMIFARALETVSSRVFEKKYPEYKARQFVPFTAEGGDNSEFITFRMWDGFFMAKVIANYATDFPSVTASATEIMMKYYDIGDSYHYSISDLRYAARAGVALTDRLQMAARRGIEWGIDEAVAVGTPQTNSYGLINNPNVGLVTLPNGTWASATGEAMLEDLNYIITAMYTVSYELYKPDTILMSTAALRKISTKLLNTGNSSGDTVMTAFMKQNPGIMIDSWTKLNTANAAGNNGRMVAYKRDPEVVEFVMGKEFEIFPPTQQGLVLTYPCMARMAGTAIHVPIGISYIDNQNL